MNKDKINQKHLLTHNALGTRKDATDKDLFDQQHRQIWADCDTEFQARKVELEDKSALTGEEEVELSELEAMFPKPPLPSRNLEAEIDELRVKIEKLKK